MGFQTETLEDASVLNLCKVAEHFPNPRSSFKYIFSCNPSAIVMQTEIFEKLNKDWKYLAAAHEQHIFFYTEKAIAYLAQTHRMGQPSFKVTLFSLKLIY